MPAAAIGPGIFIKAARRTRSCARDDVRRAESAPAADVWFRATSSVQRNLITNQAEARPIAGHDSKAVQYFLCSCVFLGELTWQDY